MYCINLLTDYFRQQSHSLKNVEQEPEPDSLIYVLRAGHYWGHRGNQVTEELSSDIKIHIGNPNKQIETVCEQGIEYYRRASIFRLVNFRLLFPKIYQEMLVSREDNQKETFADLIENAPYTPQWLKDWNPSTTIKTLETFTSKAQAIGDTAHQYRGINFVQLWRYAYHISVGQTPEDVSKIRNIKELTFKLWDVAKDLLDKGTKEKIIIYEPSQKVWVNSPRTIKVRGKQLLSARASRLPRLGGSCSNE
ncbi:MAG: hypothetical protein QNJ72_40900, partial [Pleurocapsa sp. MO_226.B13]|nr:hypothetical protein [Pleurocapsa sp. MO_226.B13]